MKCPKCQTQMHPCTMPGPHHLMCPKCDAAMGILTDICKACQAEYDASVQFRMQQQINDPVTFAATNWCDDCNDWMPHQHQHKPRKKWLKK